MHACDNQETAKELDFGIEMWPSMYVLQFSSYCLALQAFVSEATEQVVNLLSIAD